METQLLANPKSFFIWRATWTTSAKAMHASLMARAETTGSLMVKHAQTHMIVTTNTTSAIPTLGLEHLQPAYQNSGQI
jgi:hypothetical protein